MSSSGPPESKDYTLSAGPIPFPVPSPAPLDHQPVAGPSDPDPWALDPSRLPRSVPLELSEPIWRELLQRARQSGRDLGEIALDLIDQQLSRAVDAASAQGSEGGSPESSSEQANPPQP